MYPPYYSEIQFIIVSLMFLMFFAALVGSPVYALYGYMILMVFRPMQVYPQLGAMRLELLVVLFIAVLIPVKGNWGCINPDYHKLVKALLLFFLVALLSVVQAYSISHSWDWYYATYFHMLVFFIMIVCLARNINDAKWLIYVYLAMVAWLSYLPIHNHFLGIGKMRGDVIQSVGETLGVHSHVAQANLMCQTIPFAYFLFFAEKKKPIKAVLLGFIALYAMAIIFSGSRGGFMGLVVCVALFFYKAKRKFVAIIGIGLFAVLIAGFDASYLNWMGTILDAGSSDISAHSRIDGLRNGLEMCLRRPLLGVGVGCFALARKAWFGWGIWAHNLYGEIFGEVGIIGAISWGAIIVLSFKEIARIRAFVINRPDIDRLYLHMADACWTVLVVRLVLGMTTHSMYIYIWYLVASILIVVSKSLEASYPEFVAGRAKGTG